MDSALWHHPGCLQVLAGEDGADAFCVAQSVRVHARAREFASDLLSASGITTQVHTKTLEASSWLVDVGASSMTIGASVCSPTGCLAVASRKFVRTAKGTNRPWAWTQDEQNALGAVLDADRALADSLCFGEELPLIRRLSLTPNAKPPRTVFATPVLPSMLGVGGHFDHAAMLELAVDAHLLSGGVEDPGKSFEARVNYLGQAGVGDTVQALDVDGAVILRGAATFEQWERAILCIAEFEKR